MLNWTLALPPRVDLAQLCSLPATTEVLIEHRDLARFGQLDEAAVERQLRQCGELGLQAILVWDLLVDDQAFERGAARLASLPMSRFSGIRVQDPGIASWVRHRWPHLALHLILETGNHNLPGLKAWVQNLQPSRIIVSNELPLSLLARIGQAIDCELECQILGPLLIFTSPRKLISPQEDETLQPILQRHLIGAEDLKRFPVVENAHGTFMFYEKELFLLGQEEALCGAGVKRGRLDLRFYEDKDLLPSLVVYHQQPESDTRDAVRSFLSKKVTRGFFKTNRTDKQFVKLKNQRLLRRESTAWIGTVAETAKNRYLAIDLDQPLAIGETLLFITPEGHEVHLTVSRLRDSAGVPAEYAEAPGLWLVDSLPRVSTGSQVYRCPHLSVENGTGESGR